MKPKSKEDKLKYHREYMATPDKMNIGDYGEVSFTLRKKRKVPIDGDWWITTGFILRGEISDIDSNNVLIIDNDGMIYIPRKKDIRSFEPKERIKNQ